MELENNQQLDLGCVLQEGSFFVSYEGDPRMEFSSHVETLIFFFFRLVMELQKLGTAPAMDMEEYAKALDSI